MWKKLKNLDGRTKFYIVMAFFIMPQSFRDTWQETLRESLHLTVYWLAGIITAIVIRNIKEEIAKKRKG
jgi:hypothetical protein